MERMTPQNIVKTEVERTMPNTDWKVVYAQIVAMVKQPVHRIFRSNNTLFIITNNGDHTAGVMMCVADPIPTIPKSIKEFCESMKKCGFTEIQFATKRPAIFRMIERAGYKAQVFPGNNGAMAKVML